MKPTNLARVDMEISLFSLFNDGKAVPAWLVTQKAGKR